MILSQCEELVFIAGEVLRRIKRLNLGTGETDEAIIVNNLLDLNHKKIYFEYFKSKDGAPQSLLPNSWRVLDKESYATSAKCLYINITTFYGCTIALFLGLSNSLSLSLLNFSLQGSKDGMICVLHLS